MSKQTNAQRAAAAAKAKAVASANVAAAHMAKTAVVPDTKADTVPVDAEHTADAVAPPVPVEAPITEAPTVEEVKVDTAPVADPVAGVSANLVTMLNNYVAKMALNMPVDSSVGTRQQKLLQAGIIAALTVESDGVAKTNIRYILSFIDTDVSGCFGVRAIFRFYDIIAWKEVSDRREIETLITLFINTSNVETRSREAKLLNWDIFGSLFSPRRAEIMTSRLRAVYGMG